MRIRQSDWEDASGTYVQDDNKRLWRIIGFISEPTVILEPVIEANRNSLAAHDTRFKRYIVMGSAESDSFQRLAPMAQG